MNRQHLTRRAEQLTELLLIDGRRQVPHVQPGEVHDNCVHTAFPQVLLRHTLPTLTRVWSGCRAVQPIPGNCEKSKCQYREQNPHQPQPETQYSTSGWI